MATEHIEEQTADVPLPEALGVLLARRGVSLAGVASILRAEGLTIGRTRLHQIAAGQGPPASAVHMERLAQVLGVGPSYFAEYRLWKVRSLLDPSEVGFDRAMENLSRLNGRRERPRMVDAADAPQNGVARYPSAVSTVKERK
jgi:hypothetical protein